MDHALLSKEHALEVADRAIAAARRAGCAAAVAVSAGAGLSVTVRKGEVETLEHHRDKSLAVTVYDGQRKGSASTSDFSPAAVDDTVAAAAAIARAAEPDAYAGLIDPALQAHDYPDLDLDHPWSLQPDEASRIALEAEAAARGAHAEVQEVDESAVSRFQGLRAYADSNGFRGAYVATRHGISCTVVAAREGAMQRGYWYSMAREAARLEAASRVGLLATERAVAKLGARKLSTRKAPVVLENRIATGFIGHLLSAISGGALYRETSFLRGSAGTQIFPAFFNIEEQPHLARSFGAAPFDAEGARTAPRTLVERGVLGGYLLDSYAARRLGLPSTGNAGGAHLLSVSDQGADLPTLLRQMDTGVLVTDLMGFGVNLVTGDYSRGASGFWVERGEIQHAVEEITIAGNLREMFRTLVASGCDRETRGSVHCGSLLLAEMTIAGD